MSSAATFLHFQQPACVVRKSTTRQLPFTIAYATNSRRVCESPLGASARWSLAPLKLRQQRQPVGTRVFPFDQAWDPSVDAASVAPQLFAISLFPYLCFLFFLTKSGTAPRLTLIGFYFLLVFVGATIPAGIYAKSHYGTSLANVDWLHGGAESLLTITNLLIVLGLRQGIREAEAARALQGGSGQQGAGSEASAAAAEANAADGSAATAAAATTAGVDGRQQ